ncbi:MAG: polyphenol oxidase family protein [Nocardioidaceae bacterium]
MFASREQRVGAAGAVDVAFTDRFDGVSAPPLDALDLGRGSPDEVSANFALLAQCFGVAGFARMRQTHSAKAVLVSGPTAEGSSPECDGLVTTEPDVALCVRAADCVPVVLADTARGVVGVAHAGRLGVAAGIVDATVTCMRSAGAGRIEAWIGPHICGGCYEVPRQMRAEVAAVVPVAFACTTWGTPSLDLGAAVHAQLVGAGCEVTSRAVCTRESPSLYSYRRDGADAGRSAGLVVLRARGA